MKEIKIVLLALNFLILSEQLYAQKITNLAILGIVKQKVVILQLIP
ncbi:MAG: hypothetical protein IPJ51_25180 [Saprospiraceae bacterium]|nr:hypothetical protein [Saprospiraceae bacterium]